MSNKFDQEAEALLPCQWVTRLCDHRHEEECYSCVHRPAVAARLRADRLTIEGQQTQVDLYAAGEAAANRKAIEAERQLAQAQAEIERLKAEIADWKHCYDLRGRALQMPCLQCGYVPQKITARKAEPYRI